MIKTRKCTLCKGDAVMYRTDPDGTYRGGWWSFHSCPGLRALILRAFRMK